MSTDCGLRATRPPEPRPSVPADGEGQGSGAASRLKARRQTGATPGVSMARPTSCRLSTAHTGCHTQQVTFSPRLFTLHPLSDIHTVSPTPEASCKPTSR